MGWNPPPIDWSKDMCRVQLHTNQERDYVTINPAVAPHRFNVVIMRWNPSDGYAVFRISQPLKAEAALMLARSWAAASHLEVR